LTQRNETSLTTQYNYDALDRMDTASGSFGARDYNFDKNGNRRSDVVASTTTTYDYQLATNVMSAINGATVSVDANGNTTSLRGMTLGYDSLNRLVDVQGCTSAAGAGCAGAANGATYGYNALNQRVMKTVNGVSTNYTYGRNGELLSEAANDANGNTEYVYLNGAPLAVIRQGNVYYLHTDQLGTPRTMTDANQKVVWRWDSDPFGVGAANDDPDGDGVKVTMNLRFAGQYYDAESGLHYNYHRYYDPQTGRYVTSDPIGLNGGLNTFGYVGANPISGIDPLGLDNLVIAGGVRDGSMNVFGHVGMAVTGNGMYSYGNDTNLGSSVADYLNDQSKYRNQMVVAIPTTASQDEAALKYFSKHPNKNDVGTFDNCAVRTNEALMSEKLPVEGIPFPGGTARDAATLPGAKTYFIPQGGPIPPELLNQLPKYEKKITP
jgi:RHS repeat-associated protein